MRVELGGETIAETTRALRVLETSLAPSWYVPPADVRFDLLRESGRGSLCEWKGAARYFDVVAGPKRAKGAAWSYPEPTPAFAILRDHLSFYPRLVACFVDGERATPQPGGLYGGWITADVAGPFKGAPGTLGW